MSEDHPIVPVSRYVYVVLQDDTTIRGALVGNDYGSPVIELRGAEIAETLATKTGQQAVNWRVADGPTIIFKERVNYIVERP